MSTSPSYDRERAKRYKKWWARQKGQPQGELIEVSAETWQKSRAQLKETPVDRLEQVAVKDSAKG